MTDLDELLDSLSIITERSLVKDRRRVTVQAMTFGKARIIVGKPMPYTDQYFDLENGWCYLSHKAALEALETWNPKESNKPDGWIRDVYTGQYRIDGRTDLEYIKNDYGRSLEEQIAYALTVTHGEERVIKELTGAEAGHGFPAGTYRFAVTSKNPRNPKCLIDMVYRRFDRWVVLSMEHFLNATIDNVLRRLTSDNGEPWEDRNLGCLANSME